MKAVRGIPEVTLAADGIALAQREAGGLGQLRVRQRLSMPTLCELVFEDPPGPLPPIAALRPGVELRVTVRGFEESLFVGEVVAAERVYRPDHGRELRIRAYDRSHRLRKRRKVRAHLQVTARSLAQELVADLGLTVEAPADGPQWEMLVQDSQSDLELLVEAVERAGLYYSVRGDTLHLLSADGIDSAGHLRLGDNLLEATVEHNSEPACRTVEVTGWNPLTAETHRGEASSGASHFLPLDVAGPMSVGGDGNLFLVNEGLHDDDDAGAIAAAELDLRMAGEAVLEGVAEGDPAFRPGASVEVDGLGEGVTNRFLLTAVDHQLDATVGFTSTIGSRLPQPAGRRRHATTTLGEVTRVDDPESKGRIKVRLPAIGDVETDWMEIVSSTGGSGKGLVIIPGVGDTVLVLLPFADPGAGIVLGGIHGADGIPDSGGVDKGSVRRYSLLTAGGLKLVFDDVTGKIRLSDNRGSFLELARDQLTLHAETDLVISAPGHRVVVRAANVDFETA